MKREYVLDSIRGIAALMIACIFHPAAIGFRHTAGIAPLTGVVWEDIYINMVMYLLNYFL